MQTENHYTETDLGNVSPNPRGNYDNAAKYEYLDLVTMQGGSYLCLAKLGQTITGTAPESGKTTEYWQCLAMPGDRTPEYTDAHDKVVRLAREVEQNAAKVAEDKQSVTQMETDTRHLKEQTEESARQAENNKDSAAGSARAAKTAEDSARQAESNIRTLVNGFDVHVAEKTTEATQAVATAKDNAVQAVERQETASVQAVKDQTGAYITEQKNLAKQELDNKVNQFGLDVNEIKTEVAQEGAKQVKAVQDATTAELTKITEKGTEQAGIVTKEGEKQVQAVQDATQEIIADREQITKNKTDIAELRQGKADAIVETASGTLLNVKDSSNAFLEDLKVLGESTQDGTPTPDTPVEIVNKEINAIEIFGKNLLNERYYYVAYSNEIGYISENDIPNLPYTPPYETQGIGKVLHCKKGTTYTFSVKNPNENFKIGITEYKNVEEAKDIKNKIGYIEGNKNRNMTYTALGDGILLCFIAGEWTDGATSIHTCTDTELLQAEIGKEETVYERPKKSQTISFLPSVTLHGLKVDSGGNYTDTSGQQWISSVICKQNGKWGIKKYIAEMIVDQNTNFFTELGIYGAPEKNTILVRVEMPLFKRSGELLCNKLETDTFIWNVEKEGAFLTEDKIDFRISKERLGLATDSTPEQNKTAVKKYLETNPLHFVARLKTPEFEPFSEEIHRAFNALYTNYPTTVATNDAGAEMELTYVADTKIYTDNKIKEAVSTQTQNLANLLSLMPLSTQAAMIETDTNNILKDMEVQK